MGGKDLSERKKGAIEALLKLGQYSMREIARKTSVGASTVSRINKMMHTNSGEIASKRKNCGRHRITTKRNDRQIVRLAVEERRNSCREVNKKLSAQNIKLSDRTLRRRFKENNLNCRAPAKKPKLTPRMKTRRLLWAKLHRNYGVEYWNKVRSEIRKSQLQNN